jgi:hypothetical protein
VIESFLFLELHLLSQNSISAELLHGVLGWALEVKHLEYLSAVKVKVGLVVHFVES